MKLHLRILILCVFIGLFSIYGIVLYLAAEFEIIHVGEYIDPRPPKPTGHRLCVIVPYRDRLEELSEFSPYMEKFLSIQNVTHNIVIVNQTDELRFNRASLINIGWNEADRLGCDYMVMNDVDLLPVNQEVPYSFPGVGTIRHITSPEYHPKYHYEKFIGGILMLTMADFKLLNGMSNKYWGWGLEDDEFYLRISESNLTLTRVSNLSTDSTNTFRHIHGPKRKRDYSSKKNDKKQWEIKRRRDRVSGLRDVKYKIASREVRLFEETPVTIVNVILHCDRTWTPYCRSP